MVNKMPQNPKPPVQALPGFPHVAMGNTIDRVLAAGKRTFQDHVTRTERETGAKIFEEGFLAGWEARSAEYKRANSAQAAANKDPKIIVERDIVPRNVHPHGKREVDTLGNGIYGGNTKG